MKPFGEVPIECPKCGSRPSSVLDNQFRPRYIKATAKNVEHIQWSCERCKYTVETETHDELEHE